MLSQHASVLLAALLAAALLAQVAVTPHAVSQTPLAVTLQTLHVLSTCLGCGPAGLACRAVFGMWRMLGLMHRVCVCVYIDV
jgi:hypothetical protein